jgi:uncharacterized protein (TIGR02300 family)
MNRPELGHKFSCVGCGARFYDLNRSPAVCPKCDVHQPPEKPRVIRAGGSSAFGRRIGVRQPPMIIQEEPEPAAVSEVDEDADDVEESEDESIEEDSDIENLPDIGDRAV